MWIAIKVFERLILSTNYVCHMMAAKWAALSSVLTNTKQKSIEDTKKN